MHTRRDVLASISAAAAFTGVVPKAFAAWEPSERYPDQSGPPARAGLLGVKGLKMTIVSLM